MVVNKKMCNNIYLSACIINDQLFAWKLHSFYYSHLYLDEKIWIMNMLQSVVNLISHALGTFEL